MDYYLNEKSLTPAGDAYVQDMMITFVRVCRTLHDYSLGSLRLDNEYDLKNYVLYDSYHLFDWLKDERVDKELRQQFRKIATNAPFVLDDETALLAKQALSEFSLPDLEGHVLGLGVAFLGDSISVSFLSNPMWDRAYMDLKWDFIDSDETYHERAEKVRHASQTGHLDIHLDWLQALKDAKDWNPSKVFFPKQEFVDDLVKKQGGWARYYTRCKNMPETERIASYRNLAQQSAERHGYRRDRSITQKNDRDIFAAGAGRNRIYLALDTLHGTFEVCNYQGQHLGEYNFAGEQIEGADSKKKHDIAV